MNTRRDVLTLIALRFGLETGNANSAIAFAMRKAKQTLLVCSQRVAAIMMICYCIPQ